MKKTLLIFSLLFLFGSFNLRKAIVEPCDIFGIIYFEKDKFRSDARVFIEEDETLADLMVFKEDNRLFADEEGLWYVTDNPALANFRLYIEKDKRYSDFSFSYIDDRTFAGCQF